MITKLVGRFIGEPNENFTYGSQYIWVRDKTNSNYPYTTLNNSDMGVKHYGSLEWIRKNFSISEEENDDPKTSKVICPNTSCTKIPCNHRDTHAKKDSCDSMCMAELQYDWSFDHRTQTYVFGLEESGGGVYFDGEVDMWFGNSVVFGDIVMHKGYETKLEAQIAVEDDYNKIHKKDSK